MKYLLFTSTTCHACPAMKRNLGKAGIEYDEMDIETNKRVAGLYQVRSLPTLVITKGGKPMDSLAGVRPVPELLKLKEKGVTK